MHLLRLIFADIIDWATKAGTLPMQALMLLAVIMLGLVIRHLHHANQKTIQDFISRIDVKDNSMTKERLERIGMLMDLVANNVDINGKVANAVDNNTKAISDLKAFMREQTEIMGKQIEILEKYVGGKR